jgi:L-ascorbate metabolism protein UlaG (beta-lactamase superfamily)
MSAAVVTYVGHSTVRIDTAGASLLTDPVLRPRIGHIRRFAPSPDPGSWAALDAVLISHAHHDHLDHASLDLLPAGLRVLAPAAAATLLRRRARLDVIEVAPGGRVRIADAEVTAVPADHDGRRVPLGQPSSAIGYVIDGGPRIAFYGDTDVFEGMADLAGSLDLALLPIWGWGPKTGPGHMDPERAAGATALLAPRTVMPIHWGTLAGPRVWWRDDPELPAREFAAAAARLAPGVDVRVLSPGERLEITHQR